MICPEPEVYNEYAKIVAAKELVKKLSEFSKVVRVIRSCRTREHLEVAQRMYWLFDDKYNDIGLLEKLLWEVNKKKVQLLKPNGNICTCC